MSIIITGINGLVGKDIAGLLEKSGYEVWGVGRSDDCVVDVKYEKLDLMELDKTEHFIDRVSPDMIIHCAAYTKLDDCEENKEYAYKMNVEVTSLLAKKCSRFIYISSDAVFSGSTDGSYSEKSETDPVNYYGKTKYEGELEARRNKNALIVRSSLFGYRPDNESAIAEWGLRNILKDSEITGFSDVRFNPLYSKQFAEALKLLIENNSTGLFHLGCNENVSKYEFFQLLAELVGKKKELVKEGTVDGKVFKAQRTKNTCLDNQKFINKFKIEFSLKKGLKMFINDVREAKDF